MGYTLQRQRLGDMFRQSGLLSEAQLAEGVREQASTGERLGQCLLRLGHISESSLLSTLGQQLRLETIELSRAGVAEDVPKALPIDFVRRHRVLPIEFRDGTIRIATSDPGNRKVVEDVRLLTGLEVNEDAIANSPMKPDSFLNARLHRRDGSVTNW